MGKSNCDMPSSNHLVVVMLDEEIGLLAMLHSVIYHNSVSKIYSNGMVLLSYGVHILVDFILLVDFKD